MGVIKVNRIGIRRVVSDACHDLISDEKLAEEEMEIEFVTTQGAGKPR